MAFQEIISDRQVARMKTQLRAMEHKRDSIAVEIAILQNMPNIWTIDMIDWTDERIPAETEIEFFQLEENISELSWKIEEQEAIRDNEYDSFLARKTVYSFLNSLSDEESISYLKKIGMSTIGLVEQVRLNPNFIKETYEVKV